ncbi:hypothetical protein [Nonomuraea sp. NPDC049709]|uniref:hypothetical protein n=1 Tax=Nonomuraea sp. NPDC049709 TaxID=3154736 RepID=UPI00344943BE
MAAETAPETVAVEPETEDATEALQAQEEFEAEAALRARSGQSATRQPSPQGGT